MSKPSRFLNRVSAAGFAALLTLLAACEAPEDTVLEAAFSPTRDSYVFYDPGKRHGDRISQVQRTGKTLEITPEKGAPFTLEFAVDHAIEDAVEKLRTGESIQVEGCWHDEQIDSEWKQVTEFQQCRAIWLRPTLRCGILDTPLVGLRAFNRVSAPTSVVNAMFREDWKVLVSKAMRVVVTDECRVKTSN